MDSHFFYCDDIYYSMTASLFIDILYRDISGCVIHSVKKYGLHNLSTCGFKQFWNYFSKFLPFVSKLVESYWLNIFKYLINLFNALTWKEISMWHT